jgi:hypothetical protein
MELLDGSVGFSGRAWMVMGSAEAAPPVSTRKESGHESGFFQKPDGPGSPHKQCRHGPCRSGSGWDEPGIGDDLNPVFLPGVPGRGEY